jgi:spore coat protein U-like protein
MVRKKTGRAVTALEYLGRARARAAPTRPSTKAIGLCLLWGALALGALESAQAKVNISSCSVTQPPTMVFVTNLLTGLSSSTTFSVSCTTNGTGDPAILSIGLSAGSGTVAQRTQKKGSAALGYNLYQDAARTVVWGAAGAAQYAQSISGNVSNLSITIYGKIDNTPANLADTPGAYSDPSITLTLTW